MTPNPYFKGNRIIFSVIPAACLALLTLGSVSACGYCELNLLPAVLIISSVAFSLIAISLHTSS
jgi:hypothetical protein